MNSYVITVLDWCTVVYRVPCSTVLSVYTMMNGMRSGLAGYSEGNIIFAAAAARFRLP